MLVHGGTVGSSIVPVQLGLQERDGKVRHGITKVIDLKERHAELAEASLPLRCFLFDY
jgi:hypothetical protein